MSFNFKGRAIPEYVKVLEVSTSVLPPFSISLSNIEGITGTKFIRKKEESKVFDITFLIKADSPDDLKVKVRDFAEFLDSEKPEPFYLNSERDKVYEVILSGETSLEQIYDIGQGYLQFIAPDPYAKGLTKTIQITGNTPETFTMNSTAPTFPRFTITTITNSNQFKITLNENKEINLIGDFLAGDIIEIDNNIGKITQNGEVKMFLMTLDSSFFSILPGENTLTSTPEFNVEMKYVERWK
jgi:predicted phage tail component-like protein